VQKQAAEGSAQFDLNRIRIVKVLDTKRANLSLCTSSVELQRTHSHDPSPWTIW